MFSYFGFSYSKDYGILGVYSGNSTFGPLKTLNVGTKFSFKR